MDDPILAPDVIKHIGNTKIDQYLEFSRSACVPGGGFNVEQALEVLYRSNGNVLLAVQRLIANDLNYPIWTHQEIKSFEKSYESHGKKFTLISQDLKTKSVKQCVEFYYLWKKSPHRSSNTRRNNNVISISNNNNNINHNNLDSTAIKIEKDNANLPTETFPCKVCGRIFEKIKSRSAHMKRHKNEVSN